MARTLRQDLATLRAAAARTARAAQHRLGPAFEDASERAWALWQRSLGLRVALSIVVLGSVVLLVVGNYTYGRIADGLLNDKQVSAQRDAETQGKIAQRVFDVIDKTDQTSLRQATLDVAENQRAPDHTRELIITPALGNNRQVISTTTSSSTIGLEVVPTELRRAVMADRSRQQVQIAPVPEGEDTVPAVIVGQVLQLPPNAGPMELYFVYPMSAETGALRVVVRSLASAAIFLVLLLAGIAFVVTRQVVEPVRRAAQVAERLASGQLDQRMAVRGTDDLASLGRSFNRMAASLQAQIGQLKTLSTLQQQFVSDVSHELRTPLTTVRMAADLLYDSRADFPRHTARSAELLNNELNRFETLLADLLEISRFDAGAAQLAAEPVDLRDVVNQVVDDAEPLARHKDTQVRVAAPAEPVVVEMDSRRISRILRNLVVNAIEHSEGKPVTVEVAGTAQAAAVAVRDQGVGLHPGEAAKVFTRFWRADPARARTTGGTGLGLAIALEDAHLHHGWLEAWGQPGKGSTFRLTLPRTTTGKITESPLRMRPDGLLAIEAPPAREPEPEQIPGVLPVGPLTETAQSFVLHGEVPDYVPHGLTLNPPGSSHATDEP